MQYKQIIGKADCNLPCLLQFENNDLFKNPDEKLSTLSGGHKCFGAKNTPAVVL